jgi:hypothetical protein
MQLGGQLTLGNVVRTWKEKETGLVVILAEDGGAELELRLSPEDLARIKDECSQVVSNGGDEGKRFDIYLTPDDASVEARLTEWTDGLVLTFHDWAGKGAFQIVIQNPDQAMKLKEGLDTFINLRTSLAALKGENFF